MLVLLAVVEPEENWRGDGFEPDLFNRFSSIEECFLFFVAYFSRKQMKHSTERVLTCHFPGSSKWDYFLNTSTPLLNFLFFAAQVPPAGILIFTYYTQIRVQIDHWKRSHFRFRWYGIDVCSSGIASVSMKNFSRKKWRNSPPAPTHIIIFLCDHCDSVQFF